MTLLMSLLAVPATTALAQSGGPYDLIGSTIDGGGAGPANASAGGSYTLSGTIGQPDTRNHPEPMAGGVYSITGGFWVIPECPAIRVDYDGDCDVDAADLAFFDNCWSGPNVPQWEPGCAGVLLDGDADVDQDDFGIFQRCYSGEGNPADPNCANSP
jgi:hypothetical protein